MHFGTEQLTVQRTLKHALNGHVAMVEWVMFEVDLWRTDTVERVILATNNLSVYPLSID